MASLPVPDMHILPGTWLLQLAYSLFLGMVSYLTSDFLCINPQCLGAKPNISPPSMAALPYMH